MYHVNDRSYRACTDLENANASSFGLSSFDEQQLKFEVMEIVEIANR